MNWTSSPIRTFVVLAFALTWGVGGLGLLIGQWLPESRLLSTSSPLYYLAAYSVSLTGLVLTLRESGRDGLRRFGRRLLPWRSPLRWYVIVVAGYAAITGMAMWVAALAHGTDARLPAWPAVLGLLGTTVWRDPGPLGEELGWRGYALPRLLERHSPFAASVRLGLIHVAWHLPLFFIPGMPQARISLPLFAVGVVSIAVFDTALYLRTNANLLLAILVHVLANACGALAIDGHALNMFFVAEGLAAVLVVSSGGLRT